MRADEGSSGVLETFLEEIGKIAEAEDQGRGLQAEAPGKKAKGKAAWPLSALVGGIAGGLAGAGHHASSHLKERSSWKAGRQGLDPSQHFAYDLLHKPRFVEPALLRRALTGAAAGSIPSGIAAAMLNLKFHKKDRDKA